MERIYGNTATSLDLNRLAYIVYRDSDPLTITEYDTDSGLRYRLSGIIEADNLTADEVNDMLTEDEILDSFNDYEFTANPDVLGAEDAFGNMYDGTVTLADLRNMAEADYDHTYKEDLFSYMDLVVEK